MCYNLFAVLSTISKKALVKVLFWYNGGMDYMTVVIDAFWDLFTASIDMIVPVFLFMIVFTIIRGLLWHDR